MSCYNEERGTLTLPSAAVIPLRKALVDAENRLRAETLQCAQAVQQWVKEKPDWMKRLRASLWGEGPQSVFWAALEAVDGTPGGWASRSRWDAAVRDRAVSLLVRYDSAERRWTVQSPKKKDCAPLPAVTWEFDVAGEASIRIDPEKRTVRWYVSNNNRAVEQARESRMGRAFFDALARIQWTRATGGVIRYADEYSREDDLEHGGGATIRSSFGPLGEQESKADFGTTRIRRPRSTKI